VSGPDWRPFLHNLLTHDVEGLPVGQARFAGLLTPQGRLLYDVFVVATEDGALVDVSAEHRDALIQRLTMYRLRAKVEIAADDMPICAFFSAHPGEGRDPDHKAPTPVDESGSRPSPGRAEFWVEDPRLPALGHRGYGHAGSEPETAYDAHRLALGVPGPADWGSDKTYPIEANFDLLNGVDFKKGCFVGQETTSRMHRRGTVKTRMAPLTFDGPPPPFGTEILNGELRAGEVLSGMDGRAMAALRLDRIEGTLTADGRPVTVVIPGWLPA
jgi:folate-binding protein YgfZ